MPVIDSAAAAVAELYPLRGDRAALEARLKGLEDDGRLHLDDATLDEVCAFLGIGSLESAEQSSSWAASRGPWTPDDGSIGWSEFATARNVPGKGYSHFLGTDEALVERVKDHWAARVPGDGRSNLREVVVVPVPPEGFICATAELVDGMELVAEVHRRQPHEDPYVRITGSGAPEPARHARVVLYSKDTLQENDGERSTDDDWEVVALLASATENEPMEPLTMARNMLSKPGGTPVDYSAEQFARSVYYWSQRVRVRTPGG